ncbi:uncharacterized protein [Fopius arisanus]|uniref:Tesmin/TSO1-like CXC domain-containing protein n=1 Tax=Fopius arisanus TaxID=64838 RepID=A0A9R1U199_9HYME|nr:PREDICTED: uncharacterized protein LOC105266771 [Fopius arisanus]
MAVLFRGISGAISGDGELLFYLLRDFGNIGQQHRRVFLLNFVEPLRLVSGDLVTLGIPVSNIIVIGYLDFIFSKCWDRMGRPAKQKSESEAEKPKATKLKKLKAVDEDDTPDSPDENKDDIIASLQEQVKLLTIEVKTLRKHVKAGSQPPETPGKKGKEASADTPGPSKGRRSSTGQGKPKPKDKGCSCKGNCSTKICGCVKKDFYCLSTCKCSDACQNQDPEGDNENKENENNGKNQGNEIVTSPESSVTSASPKPQKSKRGKPSKEETLGHQDFNPMLPRRQLARSPLPTKSTKDVTKDHPDHPAFAEETLPLPKSEPDEEELPPPEDINKIEVDWEQHKAQLVQCSKCKRGFYAYRLKKHEASCIKV